MGACWARCWDDVEWKRTVLGQHNLVNCSLQILQGENTKLIVPGEADGPAVTHWIGGPES